MYKYAFITKPIGFSFANHFKLSLRQGPSIEKEKEVNAVLYASVVGTFMSVMVYTRPDIAYVVGIVSRSLANSRKER